MKKKKLKSILNLNKSVISKFGDMQIGAGHTGRALSQIPDAQSICLCGPPPPGSQESFCIDGPQCSLNCSPPEDFAR